MRRQTARRLAKRLGPKRGEKYWVLQRVWRDRVAVEEAERGCHQGQEAIERPMGYATGLWAICRVVPDGQAWATCSFAASQCV
jgi:hypothetical protein